jgi:hypothetical protein
MPSPTVTDRLSRDLRLILGERLDVIGSRFFLRLRLAERQRRRADSSLCSHPSRRPRVPLGRARSTTAALPIVMAQPAR